MVQSNKIVIILSTFSIQGPLPLVMKFNNECNTVLNSPFNM